MAYPPSSTFDNVGSDGLQDLPTVVPVLAQLTRPTSLVFGNGTVTTETYDALQRLSTLQATGNGEVIQDRAYSYDTGSNITGITDLAFGRSQSFAYDELNRLARAQGPYGVEDYRYDADELPSSPVNVMAVSGETPFVVLCW